MSNKSKFKDFLMAKKDYKLVGVAITIGVLAIGALLYMNSQEEPEIELSNTPRPRPRKVEVPQEAPPIAESTTVPTQPTVTATPPEVAPVVVDPVVKEQKDKLENFKNLLRLEFELPPGMHYVELDLENGVAALQATSPGRKILIMGATRTASPELIASYLREQKSSIPMLMKHDFKISGELQNVAPPKGSGIAKITVIPGGTIEGNPVYAAYLERSDKKGSYVFLLEANTSQYTQYEGMFDQMLESLKTKP